MDRAFLEKWSREWVVAHDPQRDRPMDETVRAGWLGFAPATEEQVAAAEARLGRRLPPSLRSFLLITDGWQYAGNFIYRLAGTAELAWMRDTDAAHWAEAYQSEVVARSLRLSLEGDASVLFLDPEDVGADGEWAAYRLSSWSGLGPERFDSFADLMIDLYAGFHALRKPPGETRDHWDAQAERARRAILRGEVDGPTEVLAQAERYGRDRARVLRLQLHGMQRDWYQVPLSTLLFVTDVDLAADPIFAAELVPLLFVEDRLTHRRDRPALDHLRRMTPRANAADVPAMRHLVDAYEARRAEPRFRPSFGNPEFDQLVQEIVDDLPPAAGGRIRSDRASDQARRAALDQAWPRLVAAMAAWRPVSDLHIAPVVLFTEPRLAEMITPSRGRELLRVPRG